MEKTEKKQVRFAVESNLLNKFDSIAKKKALNRTSLLIIAMNDLIEKVENKESKKVQ